MKIYIPLLYSEKVKRPGKNYFIKYILGEDFIIIILSFVFSASRLLSSIAGLFFLQMAFWCVYELGYIENDKVGEKFEEKAVLSASYKSYESSFGIWQPYLWSLCLSAIGVFLLVKDEAPTNVTLDFIPNQFSFDLIWFSQALAAWITFLCATRLIFSLYNYLNKQSRVWLYSVLQALRYVGFLTVVSTNIVGIMFALSTILTRSIQYIIYRYLSVKNSTWPMDFPRYFFCYLIYLLLIIVIAANNRDISLLLNIQVLLISLFCVGRGFKHFRQVYSQFIPISKDGSNKVL